MQRYVILSLQQNLQHKEVPPGMPPFSRVEDLGDSGKPLAVCTFPTKRDFQKQQ